MKINSIEFWKQGLPSEPKDATEISASVEWEPWDIELDSSFGKPGWTILIRLGAFCEYDIYHEGEPTGALLDRSERLELYWKLRQFPELTEDEECKLIVKF